MAFLISTDVLIGMSSFVYLSAGNELSASLIQEGCGRVEGSGLLVILSLVSQS